MAEDRIELAAVVRSLRTQVAQAWAEGSRELVGFEAGAVEIELTTEIDVVEVDGKVSARFWVLGAEAGARRERVTTQRVTLSLTPRDRREPGRPLLIVGSAEEDERRPPLPNAANATGD
jgi:hypothetical protein